MESAELDLADLVDESPDPTNEVETFSAPVTGRRPRMPAGTIAPPIAGDASDNDLDALRVLVKQHQAAHAWGEVSHTLRRMLDLGEVQDQFGEDEMLELYTQLAQLEGDVLGNVDHAIDAWRKVLAIDPTDLRGLGALEDLFAREGRWAETVEVVEKRALVLDDDDERRDTLLRAAALWENEAADPRRAIAIYERVRAADPSNEIASHRLEAIHREHGAWAEVVEILLERSETVDDVDHQVQLLHEVAKVYERELGDQESAFYVLQAAFTRAPANPRTLKELERLAGATRLWKELLDECTQRVSELERDNRAAAASLWVKIGRWYADQLSQRDYALHSMQQALRLDPSHAGALGGIASLQRQGGSWSELTETLRRQAAAESAVDKKVELYLQLADVLEQQAHDDAGAIEAHREVLALEPAARGALSALDRLYRRSEAWEPLVDVLAQRARQTTDEADHLHLLREIASIWSEQLADNGEAIAAYERVLEHEPYDLVALRALETLYDKSLQHEKYVAVLTAQLDAAHADAERIGLYERIAAAWEERLGKLDRAAEAYEAILALDPRNATAHHLLARLHKQAGNHAALVETYRRHVDATADVATQIELNVAMGKVYAGSLREVDRAIEAYNDALALDGAQPDALDALAKLYDQLGESTHAYDVLTRLVDVAGDARKPELYWRIGTIQIGQLGDPDGAEASLLRGLALAPGHVPSLDALAELYSHRGDWLKAAQMMVRAEGHAQVAVEKVRRLVDAANIYMYKLADADKAKPLYAAAIALDPEHVDAGRPLAQLYFDASQWSELSPVIDMLCRKVGKLRAEPRELVELYYRAARCAEALGERQKALGHYESAQRFDPAHAPTLIGRADLLFDAKEWAQAAALYQTVLARYRDGQASELREAEVVRLFHRLGATRQALGERKKALTVYDKALELDPQHRDTLLAVVDLQTQLGDWDAVVRAKRGLVATADDREKAKLLDEIAALCNGRLGDASKAAAIYHEALELAPESRPMLQKLLDLYTQTKQWKRAVQVIERFVSLETDPFRRGVYCHAAAALCRDELNALDEAVDYFDCALDSFFADPDRLDETQLARALASFEAIDAVLTAKRDWKAQERAYRDMIKRLPTGNPRFHKLHVNLIDAIGEIYRSRLKQYEDAIGVFEIAQQLDPDNALRPGGTDRAEILAELYALAGVHHADKAIAQHTRMLRREPFKYDSYAALARIHRDASQWDKYWCLCSTLVFLKKADVEQQEFYARYQPRGLVKAKRGLSADGWAKLAHPDENRYISAILGACWQGVAAMKAFPHKDFGVKREDRRQLASDSLMFSKLFVYVAQALNVPLPEVYLVDDQKSVDIQLANAIDKQELTPSFVVRPNLLQGKSERELAFITARRLAFMRPEYYLRMLLPTNTELKIAVLSAIVAVQPRFPVPPNLVAAVQQYLPELQKRMPAHALEQLGTVVQRFIKATPEIDVAKWGHAVDATAHRAGFIACGDLAVAARAIAAEPNVVGAPTVKDKLKELVLFSISEEYFAIRAQLGLAIGG